MWDIILIYVSTLPGYITAYYISTTCGDLGCIAGLVPILWSVLAILIFAPIIIIRTFRQKRKKTRLLWLIPHVLFLLFLLLGYLAPQVFDRIVDSIA